MLLNVGDTLEDINVYVVEAVRQDFKEGVSSKLFRERLLSEGIGHSFFRGYLWLISLDGNLLTEERVHNVLSELLSKFGNIRQDVISSFNDMDLWLNIGVVLLRDAIRYSLNSKFKNRRDIVARKLHVFNKREIVGSWKEVYAVLGISLSKIILVDENNVGIFFTLRYELYNFLNMRENNDYLRKRYLTKAAFCTFREFLNRTNKMVKLVTPLTVYFSNRKLNFIKYSDALHTLKGNKSMDLSRWLS